jgi:hypothetical protein
MGEGFTEELLEEPKKGKKGPTKGGTKVGKCLSVTRLDASAWNWLLECCMGPVESLLV